MDQPSLDQQLNDIRTLRDQNQEHKALSVADDALDQGLTGIDLRVESLGLAFDQEPWRQSLERLVEALPRYPMSQLCGGDNQGAFTRMVREYSGFRDALLTHLLSVPDFSAVRDWIMISSTNDQRWLLRSWLNAAQRETDDVKASLLHGAIGAGLFGLNDWEKAFDQWSMALGRNPQLFNQLAAFFKNSPRVDLSKPAHKLRFIQLTAAADHKPEALSLLQALGMENPRNAVALITDIPQYLPFRANDKEVARMRINLAAFLGKPEGLVKVIGGLQSYDGDDIFALKKHTRSKIRNPSLRRTAMLEFARVYIRKNEWEEAAMLLESLFEEEPHDEIVALIEHVIDHYPILTHLHFLVGAYHLANGRASKAMPFLDIAGGVKEYRTKVTSLLEDALAATYNRAEAELLLKIETPRSHRATLVAWLIIHHEGERCESVLEELERRKPQRLPSPYWFLAMIYGSLNCGRVEKAYELLCDFLVNFVSLSPEVIRAAEELITRYRGDYTHLHEILNDFNKLLSPQLAWRQLSTEVEQLIGSEPEPLNISIESSMAGGQEAEAKSDESGTTPDDVRPPAETVPVQKIVSIESDTSETGDEVRYDVTRRNEPVIAQEVTQTQPPEHPREVVTAGPPIQSLADLRPEEVADRLVQLERWAYAHPDEAKWTLTLVRLLLETEDYQKAIEIGTKAIEHTPFQNRLADFYQMLAQAHEGANDQGQAARFYVLASRNPAFFQENRTRFTQILFPEQTHLLKEVLQQTLNQEDRLLWTDLMTAWHRHEPEKIAHLLQAQQTFTQRVQTAGSKLDLAFWHLQAGKIREVGDILDQIDLRDPDIRNALIDITNLASLKYPEDPKPRLVQAHYYLLQREVTRAVTAFRNLAQKSPETAEPIFRLVQTYLTDEPDAVDRRYLYGLLVRFSLSYHAPLSAVKLLAEYGEIDRDAAASLTRGVFRVLSEKETDPEAMFALIKLHRDWGDYDRMLKFHEMANLGEHMASERLLWLKEAREQHELSDSAGLAAAKLQMLTADFQGCRRTLSTIRQHTYRRQTLDLYEKLIHRFPDHLDLWREAGWAAYTEDKERARQIFQKLLDAENPENHVEAYAVLRELGDSPDFQRLTAISDEKDRIFAELREVYARVRRLELAHWEIEDEEPPIEALEWLLTTGQIDRFEQHLPQLEQLEEQQLRTLEARYLRALGSVSPSAWRMHAAKAETALQQSFFMDVGLVERAVAIKPPGERLPHYIRDAFLKSHRSVSMIQARITHIAALRHKAAQT